MRRSRASLFCALLLCLDALPAQAVERIVVEDRADALARRRTENHRRDCEAQWQGISNAGKIPDRSQEQFIASCLETAAVRCHPKGSDARCPTLKK